MTEELSQKVIDKLFQDNPTLLVDHQLKSYNDFMLGGIERILKEKNPIKIIKNPIKIGNKEEFQFRCNLYLGGKEGNQIYYGKPIIYDDNREHYMYPNEARLRNMTYGITIHYDVFVEYFIMNENDTESPKEPTSTTTLEKIFLGRFPIMLMSDLCILKGLPNYSRFELGECKNDYGGYFIIDGKEKVIVSQEKFADNMLYVTNKVDDIYSHAANIRSVSEDASKPVRTLSVRIVSPSPTLSNNQIVVNIANVRKPVPLFILMRALGVESDKSIIEHCLLDMDIYSNYIDLFTPSIHDAGMIFNQEVALKYIASLTKGKTVAHALEILTNYFLPHIGEMNFRDKAYFLGHMVFELLQVYKGIKKPTDRDNFRYKRVEQPGTLLYDLFKEYYTLQQRNISLNIDNEYHYKKGIYQNNFTNLIELNYKTLFADRVVETGFKKAFKGNWGAETHTKRMGVVQPLNRLSYNSALSHLRKINLPLDASAKVVGPRLLHSSQWGIIDPVDTPDGGNVGLHKHMAISTVITSGYSGNSLFNLLRNIGLRILSEGTPKIISSCIKVFVNGNWLGFIDEPKKFVNILRSYKRLAIIPIYTSIYWNIMNKTISISTDPGRLCRPIYYIENKTPSYKKNEFIMNKLSNNDFTWNELITGFEKKKDNDFNIYSSKVYSVRDLYNISNLNELNNTNAIIEYIDSAEAEGSLISIEEEEIVKKPYTHIEIHGSLLMGVMGNQVVFPENNQLPRDLFACGQMRQAVSLYHSNYQNRIDKMGVVLNYGQIPLVKSRYLKRINNEEHPYGENVIVAIMCYGGYNVEDSILFNEGSVKRGLFRTTYYNMYETNEESSKVAGSLVDSQITNVLDENAIGLKPGYDYSHLDKYGLVKENTYLNDKIVMIGKTTTNIERPDVYVDSSIFPKKGQYGYVDKSFITDGEEGFRIAKVRVRDERIPAIGDKFCSRCGQKGTIGLIIPEEDMPFTHEGIRPDLIINPHALPSRMTIGQLVETLMGKACSIYGGFGDCTAFINKGSKNEYFGKLLTEYGYHSSGNQLLYNGQTGEQIESEIFIGPTYYMRLKHMVKDKINHRAKGPRTLLTRQTVQGRANDGGLRIGEMERDGIIAHGATRFLQESMLVRGDDYYVAVCNKTGMLSIYNPNHNLFISPMADGPIQYSGTLDEKMTIQNITKYGRSFSILRVPYAFKLLMQELQTMNVNMRIITDKNIDQITNMSFSKQITKLTSTISTKDKPKPGPKPEPKTKPTPTLEEEEEKEKEKEEEDEVLTEDMPLYFGWKYDDDTKDENIWHSLIIRPDGTFEKWYEEDYNKVPDTYPKDWIIEDTILPDGKRIPNYKIIEKLLKDKLPNNWERSIVSLFNEYGYDISFEDIESSSESKIDSDKSLENDSDEEIKPISVINDSMEDNIEISPLPEISPPPLFNLPEGISPGYVQDIESSNTENDNEYIDKTPEFELSPNINTDNVENENKDILKDVTNEVHREIDTNTEPIKLLNNFDEEKDIIDLDKIENVDDIIDNVNTEKKVIKIDTDMK